MTAKLTVNEVKVTQNVDNITYKSKKTLNFLL